MQAFVGAKSMARAIAAGRLTCVEAFDAFLERHARWHPVVNAVVSLDEALGRRQARALDAELRRRGPRGPLHGVPLTLKDAHDVAGLRVTLGIEALARVPARDGTVAARLRAAGANLVAHTNVPPGLADFQSANPRFGRTNNPWNPGRTAGGSSGGAAAAVAAGVVPLEVGSDLAGSIRQPASYCGIYGLKPTEGRIPVTGFFALPGVPRALRVMGVVGPMARSLDDLELGLRLLAGPDGLDAEAPEVPLSKREVVPLRGVRVAVAAEVPGVVVAPAMSRAVESLAAALGKKGAKVKRARPALEWESPVLGELVTTLTTLFDPGVEKAEPPTLAWYLGKLAERDALLTAWARFFDDFDVLVMPAATSTAFAHAAGSPAELGRLLGPVNGGGVPSLVVPAGLGADGLPVGVQLVGPRWADQRLIDVARAAERAGVSPGFVPPPLPAAR